MGASFLVALALAGFGGEPPDGQLVLGVAGSGPERAVVADPRTGLTRERRLPGGTLCHGPLLALGDRIVFSGYRGRRPVARTLPFDLSGPARSLGYADTFTPSASAGRLWLGRWPAPKGGVQRWSNRAIPVTLTEVDAGGRTIASRRDLLPRFGSLHAEAAGGLVATFGRWLTLRRPGAERPMLRVRDGWFVAAAASRFAWCRGDCPALHVRSRRGQRLLKPPADVRPIPSGGAFSPDQRQLATAVRVGGRSRAAVVDVASGRWTLVPGGALGGYDTIAWSPSGRWLYFTDSNKGLRAWRLGAERAVPLPVRTGGSVLSIATAPS